MACNSPIQVWRSKEGKNKETGKWPITFRVSDGYKEKGLLVPCGKCAGCLMDRARQWAVRCMLEASLWTKNCFITLTYNDENLPDGATLVKRDFELFMKRLRKKFGSEIRFYMCGEYGGQTARPHYHACLFNFDFPDKYLFRKSESGSLLYRSPSLEKLWPYGFCTIGDVTVQSASYVARYVTKKISDVPIDYGDREPEYTNMSRKPGIAKAWLEKYYASVYSVDRIVLSDKQQFKVPRYFDNLYEKLAPDVIKSIRQNRRFNALKSSMRKFGDLGIVAFHRGIDLDADEHARQEQFNRLKIKRMKRGL